MGPTMRSFQTTISLASVVFGAMLSVVAAIPNLAIAQGRLPQCPSDTHVPWTNCHGAFTAANGDEYVGDWQDNKLNGQGLATYSSGQKYVGEFKNGKRDGNGILTFLGGQKYVGEFKDGNYGGHGALTLSNGEKYVGEFKDGKENGQGTYTFPSGEEYVGEFKNDQKDGQFTVTYPNGDKYVGQFKDDKKNGKGAYTYHDGKKYLGEFKDGNENGQGTYTFPSGEEYVGEFRDDAKNGQFTATYPNGDKYVGQFKDDKKNGQGAYTFKDGKKYVGEFKDGNYDGQGALTYANGEKYVGEFKNNKMNGQGTLYDADGSIKNSGVWSEDQYLSAGTRVALIIANSNYNAQIPLQNPINDAKLLASSLSAAGFKSVTVKTDLTRERMLNEIHDFAALADTADWAVVYYSGHGISYSGVNYMVPVDAKLAVDRDVDLEAIDVGKVFAAIDGAKKLRLVILDMCRSNPFMSTMRRTVASRSIGRGLAPMEPDAGVLTVFAAKDGQEALDGDGKNSPFAKALAKYINKPNLEVRRLFDYVRDDVMDSTDKKQQPFTYGSLPGKEDFYFIQR